MDTEEKNVYMDTEGKKCIQNIVNFFVNIYFSTL